MMLSERQLTSLLEICEMEREETDRQEVLRERDELMPQFLCTLKKMEVD